MSNFIHRIQFRLHETYRNNVRGDFRKEKILHSFKRSASFQM